MKKVVIGAFGGLEVWADFGFGWQYQYTFNMM